jgi:hypothetical protein
MSGSRNRPARGEVSAITKPLKLTEPQWRMLDRICRTNGGGITVGITEGPDYRMAQRLADKGLVQGKSGVGWMAVHTREGLKYWRERNAAASGDRTDSSEPS